MKVYKFTASRAFSLIGIAVLIVGLVYAFVPQVSISTSKPITIAKADAAPEKGSASNESPSLLDDKTDMVNPQADYDLPPDVSNTVNYHDVKWNDYLKYQLQHPCQAFEIIDCDPEYVVKVKAKYPFRYQDRKYSKWFCIPKDAILYLNPGRYFFPKGYMEFLGKIILQPGEDSIKRCQVEVYNLDRVIFVPQAILKYDQVYETFFENPLFYPSRGF